VFHGLRSGKQASIKRGRALVFLGDLVAFIDDAVDRGAFLALGFSSISSNTSSRRPTCSRFPPHAF
jgi:hypothetical protein